jgi:hypothetical protein
LNWLVHHHLMMFPTEFSKALRFQSILVGGETIFIAKQGPMNLENVTYLVTGPARLPAMVTN